MAQQYETKRVKLATTRGGFLGKGHAEKELEKLIADGWEIVSENKKGILEWGTKDSYILRRPID